MFHSTSVFSRSPGSSKLFGKQCVYSTDIHEVPTVCQSSRTQPRGWRYRPLFLLDPTESEKQTQLLCLYDNINKDYLYFKKHTHCLEMAKASKHCNMHYSVLGAMSIGYRSCKSILHGKPPSKALFHI